jgi:phospholipid/cholesterol/gamma-HCH transport system substrate-binding protein
MGGTGGNMNRTVKAGVFVVVTIIILMVSWVWLANIKMRGECQDVVIRIADVTGLRLKDVVKVWGVEKGKVDAISFRKDHIEVKVVISADVDMFDDANAEILDVAMISGTKYLAVDPGRSGVPLPPGTLIPGKSSLGIPLSLIGELGDKTSQILSVIESAGVMESLGATLLNLEKATSELAEMISENRKDLKETTRSLKESSASLQDVGDRISSTAAHADSLICDISKGEGTLGKLVNDDSLYVELASTISAIRELAEDIKANPRRYLKLF